MDDLAQRRLQVAGVGIDANESSVAQKADPSGPQRLGDEQGTRVLLDRGPGEVRGRRQRHRCARLGQVEGNPEADPVALPIGDEDPASGQLRVLLEVVAGPDDEGVIGDLEVRHPLPGAGGDDDVIGGKFVDDLLGHRRRGADVDARPDRLGGQVRRRSPEFGPVGQLLGQQHRPAEVGPGFAEDDLVALLSAHRGGLESGRSPADDEDPAAGADSRTGQERQLPAGFGVLDARDRHAELEMADTGLVAADAGADLLDGVAARLAGHGRVADHRAGHDRHVRPPFSDGGFRLVGLVDAAGDHDGFVGDLLDLLGQVRRIGGVDLHRRHDVHGPLQGRGVPGGDREVVEAVDALILQFVEVADEFEDLGGDESLFGLLLPGDPQAHHDVRADGRADGGDHLGEESATVGRRPAVLIGAGVDAGVEELDGQVAVAGDDLDAVDAGARDALRGTRIAGDDVLDRGGAQRFGDDLESFLGCVAGCHGPRCHAALSVHDLAAGVEELGDDRRSVAVDRLGDGSVAGHRGVVGGHEDVVRVARGLVDAGDLEDDESGAAGRTGFMVGDEVLTDLAMVVEDGVMSGGDDAVADRVRAQRDGFEEVREQLRHDRP